MTTTEPAVPSVGLDPFEPGFFDDPYTQYRRVRESAPVHRTLIGAWALLRYDDVVKVLRDPSLSVEEQNADIVFEPPPEIATLIAARERRGGNRAMLNLDPPDHHRLRRLVAKVFTPTAIEELRPAVQALVDEMLDAAAGRDEMDVIRDLAFPLPFTVISDMLGIPESRDRFQLRAWSSALVKTFDPLVSTDDWHAALDAGDNMRVFIDEVIADKRANPDDKLLSALIATEDEGDRLSSDELLDQVILLYIAGHETTVNLIGNGTLALLRNRGELERLRDDPSLDANAVEELLRYDSPVQNSRRIALQPLQIGGFDIPSGGVLLTVLGAANHDPDHFGADADDLDLSRANAASHTSFGGGVHHCLGAFLARLEGQVAIPSLIRRFPGLELARDTQVWNGRIVLRGLAELPVSL